MWKREGVSSLLPLGKLGKLGKLHRTLLLTFYAKQGYRTQINEESSRRENFEK